MAGSSGSRRRASLRVAGGTKVIVTQKPYADGDGVGMPDGQYQAVGPSRPLAFDEHSYATTVCLVTLTGDR